MTTKMTPTRLTPLAGAALAVLAAGSLLAFSLFAQDAGKELYSSPRQARPQAATQNGGPVTLPGFAEPTTPGAPIEIVPIGTLPPITPTLDTAGDTPIVTTGDAGASFGETTEGPTGRLFRLGGTGDESLRGDVGNRPIGFSSAGTDHGNAKSRGADGKKRDKHDRKGKVSNDGAYRRHDRRHDSRHTGGGSGRHTDASTASNGGHKKNSGGGHGNGGGKGHGGRHGNGRDHGKGHGNRHSKAKSKAKKN